MLCCFELTGSGQEIYNTVKLHVSIQKAELQKGSLSFRRLFVMSKNNEFLSVWLETDRQSNQFWERKAAKEDGDIKRKTKHAAVLTSFL